MADLQKPGSLRKPRKYAQTFASIKRNRRPRVEVPAGQWRIVRHVSLSVTVISLATVFGAAAVFFFRLLFGEP